MNQPRPIDPQILAALSAPSRQRARSRRIGWMIGFGIVAVLLGTGGLWITFGGGSSAEFVTGTVERGTLRVEVTATGTLEPVEKVEVGAELSGRIEEVLVDFNDPVEKGQVLAKLDIDLLEAKAVQSAANLQSSQASVRQAEATLKEATNRRNRVMNLAKSRTVSSQEVDTAEANLLRAEAALEIAKAQVALAEAQLKVDQENLGKAEIRSPIDGTVLDRKIEAGQTVAASFQTPVLFTLASDLRQMELQVDVDEADIGDIAAGQPATFTVDAFPNRRFDAKILKVHNAPLTVQNVVTYRAILSVDNVDGVLKPGMTATADITVKAQENVLTVPNGALRFTPPNEEAMPLSTKTEDANLHRVWLDAGSPEPRDIRTGATDGQRTEILSGELEPGDTVLIDLVSATRPGLR
jgi:HlyD family secretion protein